MANHIMSEEEADTYNDELRDLQHEQKRVAELTEELIVAAGALDEAANLLQSELPRTASLFRKHAELAHAKAKGRT